MLSKLPFTALLAAPLGHVLARATIDTSDCTKITPECPIEYTTYGYYPNLGGNVFFLLFFSSLFVAQVYLGIRCKTWSYTAALATGTLFEALGYYSPLKPNFYPWIFVGCDAGSIVIQAIGGGVASAGTGGGRDSVAELGNHIMVAGIVFQVVTMGLCGCLIAFYIFRYQRRHVRRMQGTSQYETSKANGTVSRQKVMTFAIVLTIAYFLVLIRCIYRIPELAGGWGNHLMRIEKEFLVLDGMMIALASLILTIYWPSCYFPPFAKFRVDKHLPLASENIAL
ncbi:parasitic phase-specific PSP-1 [Fusarium subglutinans]|uniref:Parasitic phase-specific PSP-1 n=1 Tax=Gibberella subglutinans TaxID=42677 RepID=A0A8H5NXJ1_GIBSU|nr:parasitic phase-specific PSP-1 [Fusarium subglutinans]KAF5580598.1 parasitic phase-specific PSP-1 [Fusarium subglutinans]